MVRERIMNPTSVLKKEGGGVTRPQMGDSNQKSGRLLV
jgi:hypothetical protein